METGDYVDQRKETMELTVNDSKDEFT
jgi:hypothetical protein